MSKWEFFRSQGIYHLFERLLGARGRAVLAVSPVTFTAVPPSYWRPLTVGSSRESEFFRLYQVNRVRISSFGHTPSEIWGNSWKSSISAGKDMKIHTEGNKDYT